MSFQECKNVLRKLLNLAVLWTCGAGWLSCNAQPILTATDLIVGQGYPAEFHRAWTADNFELGMQRIPPTKAGSRAVLLMHGVFTNAGCWVANFPFNDLAFMLHDAGWDVWLGNFRGTVYSYYNANYTADEEKFWEWSWPEMGTYDVPAMIDYVLDTTGHKQLTAVCHSEGCANSLVALSTLPEYADKIGFLMALAPAVYVGHTTSLPAVIGLKLDFGNVLYDHNIWHMKGLTKLEEFLLSEFCESYPEICALTLDVVMGWDMTNCNASRMPVYLELTDSTSTRNLQHGFEAMATNLFAYYDYQDNATNIEYYGATTVPLIPLWNIKNKMALYYGGRDALVTEYDVINSLLPSLSNAEFVIPPQEIPMWNHADFVLTMDGTWYTQMVDVLDTFGI
ncbi:gastric triacylglycerol lipase [Pelomyxa schiedti]|nr:gastric triacylglycerol lipase [Pelomyxa schiedti]